MRKLMLLAAVLGCLAMGEEPDPKDIVNVHMESPTKRAGEPRMVVIYRVPTDKVFVLKQVDAPTVGYLLICETKKGNDQAEVKLKLQTDQPVAWKSDVGIVFQPGSTVTSFSGWDDINFTGYLAKP